MAYFVADLMPKLTDAEWQIRLLAKSCQSIASSLQTSYFQHQPKVYDYTLDADVCVINFLRVS